MKVVLNLTAIQGQAELQGQILPSEENKSFPLVLPKEFADPADPFWEEVRWYIEEYARNDPFSFQRAESIEEQLRSYSELLAQAVCASDAVLVGLYDSELLILINDHTEYSPRLSRIHWESLENVDIWDAALRPCRVSVVRRTNVKTGISEESLTTCLRHDQAGPPNILAVSVRPNLERDIPYRLITRSILDVVAEEQKRGTNAPTFEIVRPGTFEALQQTLERRGNGHFDIVHFDLHGFVSAGNAFLKFLRSNENLVGVRDVPLSDVANLLARHGVRVVILNACQSASEQGPHSNIARSMVQQGVLMAIGMRYEILDSAAEIFTKAIYRQLLKHGQELWTATSIARLALRINPQRQTKFLTGVSIQDYITPALFYRSDLKIDHPRDYESEVSEVDAKMTNVNLFGRESDILAIETKLANSNVLLLNGSPGAGKTFLTQHLCRWWKATGFIKDFVTIDCTKMGNLNIIKVQAAIAHGFGLASNEPPIDVLSYLNLHRCLIVIDHLDAAQLGDESEPREEQISLRRFIRKIKQSFVVIVSRCDENWIKAAAKVTYYLTHLDMKSSLQLAMKQVADSTSGIAVSGSWDSRFLEQCISLVDGNPLAIILIMRAYCSFNLSMKDFYTKLTDSCKLDQNRTDIFAEDCSRAFNDARRLVRLHTWSHPSAPIQDADFRLLAPFWRTFPIDLNPYRLLFLWATSRVSEDSVPFAFNSHLKSCAERFTDNEYKILLLRGSFDDSATAQLSSMSGAFESCERQGFLSRTSLDELVNEELHMKMHPLMTLALRQKEFALPERVQYAAEIAYERFYVYRTRHWPKAGMLKAVWDSAKIELSFEFANYITASNYLLRVAADPQNVYLLKLHLQTAFCLNKNPRRMCVVFDVLERFLATFGTGLAQQRSGLAAEVSSRLRKFQKAVNKTRQAKASDARGMLEMLCILAILITAQSASSLGIARDYSPLLEGIATNFLPDSDFADVNLPLLRMCRIMLSQIKNPSGDRTKAAYKAMGLQHDPFLQTEEARTRRPFSSVTTFNYQIIDQIEAADNLDEINRLEKHLQNILEEQLDGVDTINVKTLIYEGLSVLAFKRCDFTIALRHVDKALELAKSSETINPQGVQKLLEHRTMMLETQAASAANSQP